MPIDGASIRRPFKASSRLFGRKPCCELENVPGYTLQDASEDKDFVRPIAEALVKAGIGKRVVLFASRFYKRSNPMKYVGIDLHKKTISGCVVVKERGIVKWNMG